RRVLFRSLSTLAVVGQIERQKLSGNLAPEDAENIKRIIIDSTIGLFECNALPTEVRPREAVDNSKLLADFSPKLLTEGMSKDSTTGHVKNEPNLSRVDEEHSAANDQAGPPVRQHHKKKTPRHRRSTGAEKQP